MAHTHHHNHGFQTPAEALDKPLRRRLALTLALNIVISVVEVVGGLFAGSLALISDALHNLSDAAAIVVSYVAMRLAGRPTSLRHTFGLKRAEILAAVINAAVLIGIAVYLCVEAVERFWHPQPVHALAMLGVASVGFAANAICTWLLHRGAKQSLNLRAVYLHLLSDAVASLGVIVGALCMLFWGWHWIDPLLTLLISVYIIRESWVILKRASHILMMGTPDVIDLAAVKEDLMAIQGVNHLHHLHAWALNDNHIHFEAHVDVDDQLLSQCRVLHEKLLQRLEEQHGVHHVTLQFESKQCPQAKS